MSIRWKRRFLVIEAIVWLCLAGLAVRLLPFRRLMPWLGPIRSAAAGADDNPSDDLCFQARRVGAAVRRAATLLPWRPVCLPQAIAAKAMLARRGVSTCLCLGAARKEAGLVAHAWLMLGPLAVIGGASRTDYAELVGFG